MKRDMEMVRGIMLMYEEGILPRQLGVDCSFTLPSGLKCESNEILYHVDLLIRGGLLEGKSVNTFDQCGPLSVFVTNITWAGHDFLDATRNDGVWAKFKDRAGVNLASLGFEVVKVTCAELAKKMLLGEV